MNIKTKLQLKELIYSETNRSSEYYYNREYAWKIFFPEFYNELNSWNFPDDFIFKQKVYHYLNDDPELKLGICPECGKRCNFTTLSKGYHKYCSIY